MFILRSGTTQTKESVLVREGSGMLMASAERKVITKKAYRS